MKNNKAITVFLLGLLLMAPISPVLADGFEDGYFDIPSYYGSGYTDIPSYYGSGYTDLSSYYGSGYTDIASYYGSGYTDIPSYYGSGYTDIPSYYGSGYTDIPSYYGSGYTDIPSYYGSGYTDIPSYYDTYGSGYTDIPSYYDSGYTSVTYTTPSFTSYTSPTVYSTPIYSSPAIYTTPTYTTPTYTTPVVPVTPVTPPVQCPAGTTLTNGVCVPQTQCPAGQTLVGGICRPQTQCPSGTALVNGVCQAPTQCPAGSTLVNGVCQITATQCPFGTSFVNGVCQFLGVTVCPSGSTLVNGACIINQTTCPAGTTLVNGVCQAPTQCPAGTYFSNGSCHYPVTPPPVVTYQTCWDGSVIPLTSVCPPQYKTCPNGTSIPVNQTCYYSPVPTPPTPPVTIKFNNVITSVVTEITKSSARCNGIGLVASNAPSTGWFEYGETANLGRETGKAAIGSSPTSPFSNVLMNLKPSTSYYCRAVMQNQYGVVKGEIVAFKTKATAVTYVKPVTKPAVKTTTKPAAKKTEIVCIDGTVVSTGSKSSTELINSGQKLVSLQIEKVSGNLAAGGVVNYKLGFKNLANEALKGVTIKVTVPQDITFMQATSGTYDPTTRTLTTTISSLPASAEGSIGWTGSLARDVQVGKPIAMTGYASYTVPGTDVQDEVTAYTVGSVVPTVSGTDTGDKKVVGATSTDRGFLPNSLVEWLALIAIIFIVFILARSAYSSYKDDRPVAH